MAGAPQGGTTANASNFSLNEDIKLPMGGGYQPMASVGVFGGPQQGDMFNMGNTSANSMVDTGPQRNNNFTYDSYGMPRMNVASNYNDRGLGRELSPDALQGDDPRVKFFRDATIPQPQPINSGVQQMAAPQQGGYNVNAASAKGLQQCYRIVGSYYG